MRFTWVFTETHSRYEPQSALGSAIVQCLPGVPKAVYLYAFKFWILRLETEFLLRDNPPTG